MDSDPSKRAFKTTILFLALSVLFGIGLVIFSNPVSEPPQSQLEGNNSTPEGTLPIISGTYLIARNSPTIRMPVLGTIISIEGAFSFCDVGYIENFFPADISAKMSKICYCESLGETDRINSNSKEYSVGLLQINILSHPEYNIEWLKIPENNMKAGYEIYQNEGLNAWKNCNRITN